MRLSFDDLCNIIDDAVANEKVVDFYIKGDLAKMLVDYLECEHGMTECEDCQYENAIDDYKIYSLSLDAKDEFQFFLEEAYFNGILLENDGEYSSCSYIDKACEMTQFDRIHGNRAFFDLEETNGCEDCNGCIFEGECENDEEDYALNILLDRIENLEDRVSELESAKSEERYFVADFEITKDTFDKFFESRDKLIDKYLKW